jgi:hypothetical protein
MLGFVALGVVTTGAAARPAAKRALSLVPPHRPIPLRATIADALRDRADKMAPSVTSIDQAIQAALAITCSSLSFGMGHKARWHFDEHERVAHCEEYAQLFAVLLVRILAKVGHQARVSILRSNTRILGRPIYRPGWRTHDWVRVVDTASKRPWCVDPSFADTGLGWDVSDNVVVPAAD